LDIHRNWVHGDVCGCSFHIEGERCGITTQALRANTQRIHRFLKLRFQLGAFRIGAARSQRAGCGDFRQMHAKIGSATHTHNRRRADLAASLDHTVQHKALHRGKPIGGQDLAGANIEQFGRFLDRLRRHNQSSDFGS
jgi:hypothetical protein